MRLVLLCCVVGLAGCSFGAPKSPAELSREDACRALADRAYNLQHPDYLSRGDDQSTTPFSGSGTISLPSEGLSDEYAHRVAVDDCVRRQTSSTQGGASVGPSGSH